MLNEALYKALMKLGLDEPEAREAASESQRLARMEENIGQIHRQLADHSTILAEHSATLAEHSAILLEVRTTQADHGQKLDFICEWIKKQDQ